MADLISRKALLAEYDRVHIGPPGGARKLIEDAPAVDAVPVRCKDCEHWHEETGWCNHHSHFIDSDGEACHPWESSEWKMFDADDFCSMGERRTDNA